MAASLVAVCPDLHKIYAHARVNACAREVRAKEFQVTPNCDEYHYNTNARARTHVRMDGTCRACGASLLDSKARRPLQNLPKPVGRLTKGHFK